MAIDNDGNRFGLAPGRQPRHDPMVAHHHLEAACSQPAPRLPIHTAPSVAIPTMLRVAAILGHSVRGRRSSGIHAMAHPSHDAAQPIEHLAQVMLSPPHILPSQQQIRRYQKPFLVADVGRIRPAV